MKHITCILILFFALSAQAQELDKNELFRKAKEQLSNWYYFQKNNSLNDYELTTKYLFWGKTSEGVPIVVIVFPEKHRKGSACVYFEYANGNLKTVRIEVNLKTVEEIRIELKTLPADWLYEEG